MAKPPNDAPPGVPAHHEKTDAEYVHTGRVEIVVGVALLVVAVVAYVVYNKSKGAVMTGGVASLTIELPQGAEHEYVRGPEGTEAKVIGTAPGKGGSTKLKVEVRLVEGALAPGTYKVEVGLPDNKTVEGSFVVKAEQKAAEGE